MYIVRVFEREEVPLPGPSERHKPDNFPEDATWCDEDSEWVKGLKDPDGKYHGEVHYWRHDGTLCCISTLVHGKAHGPYQRFHENGEVSNEGAFLATCKPLTYGLRLRTSTTFSFVRLPLWGVTDH